MSILYLSSLSHLPSIFSPELHPVSRILSKFGVLSLSSLKLNIKARSLYTLNLSPVARDLVLRKVYLARDRAILSWSLS